MSLPAWARVSERRRNHVGRVAALVERWADALGTPTPERTRWLEAVWLHDALRDASGEELAEWAGTGEGSRALLHGPAAANRAYAEGERDIGILTAVRFHSLGSAEWDQVGQVLYCADFLEPGRTFEAERRATLAGRFPAEPEQVLYDVAQWRIYHLIDSGWRLPETTYRFWNSLVPGSAAPAA
jgi:HD superfamily phosphohydrolase YqeK